MLIPPADCLSYDPLEFLIPTYKRNLDILLSHKFFSTPRHSLFFVQKCTIVCPANS